MTFLRTIPALILTSLLAACGGQYDAEPGVQAAMSTLTVGAPQAAAEPATAATTTTATAAAVATVATATMPAPDCALEGCASLRIIDGNAEAWRIDAERRAALEARLAQL